MRGSDSRLTRSATMSYSPFKCLIRLLSFLHLVTSHLDSYFKIRVKCIEQNQKRKADISTIWASVSGYFHFLSLSCCKYSTLGMPLSSSVSPSLTISSSITLSVSFHSDTKISGELFRMQCGLVQAEPRSTN